MTDLPDFRKLWNFQKPAETEVRFREILPQAEASADKNYLLELKTQIGRTLGLQGRFERVYVSDAIGHVKPEFEAFAFAQEQAGSREITYVDDKPGNVAAARAVFADAMTVDEALESLVGGEAAAPPRTARLTSHR